MTTASLTPGADAARQAVEQMRILAADDLVDNGSKGVAMRLTFAVTSALCVAVAEEFDRCSDPSHLFEGVVNALVNAISQSSKTFVGTEDAPRCMSVMADKLQYDIERLIGGAQFDGHQVFVPAANMSRA